MYKTLCTIVHCVCGGVQPGIKCRTFLLTLWGTWGVCNTLQSISGVMVIFHLVLIFIRSCSRALWPRSLSSTLAFWPSSQIGTPLWLCVQELSLLLLCGRLLYCSGFTFYFFIILYFNSHHHYFLIHEKHSRWFFF